LIGLKKDCVYEIPYGVTRIGDDAFRDYDPLTIIIIPETVTHIGNGAFNRLLSLTTIINIPSFVTNIGNSAFEYCEGLTSIRIPKTVKNIGKGAFARCSGLISIVVEPDNPVYDSREDCNAIIETATNTLIAGCRNTVIPASVTSIGDYAFKGIAFIDIPSSVTHIGNNAFAYCEGLTSIRIPETVISIGEGAFAHCSELSSIVVEPDNPMYDSREDCNAIIESATNTLVAGCPCTKIPSSVTSIGNRAFDGSMELTSLQIPDSVTRIGEDAFSECYSLTIIEIPDSVTSIGEAAFSGCNSLTIIEIPDSVTHIADNAFLKNYALEEIHVRWRNLKGLHLGDHLFYDNPFDNYLDNIVLFVPAGTADIYRQHPVFSQFGKIIEE
jgi:hypothetical protein